MQPVRPSGIITAAAAVLLASAVCSASAAAELPLPLPDDQLQLVLQQLLAPVVQRAAAWWQQPLLTELLRLQQDHRTLQQGQEQLRTALTQLSNGVLAGQEQLQQDQEQLQQGQEQLRTALTQLSDGVLAGQEALLDRLNASLAAAEAEHAAPDAGVAAEPECELSPSARPGDVGPYQEPAHRACARSCLQLRDQANSSLTDGVYWLTAVPVPVFCDFSHDGGGWTLLLTAATKQGWDVLSALSRNVSSPSLSHDYSILKYADSIRDLGTRHRFAYRIEAQAETGRRQWGGIWLAPRAYSFVHDSPTQTDVHLVRRFNQWTYKQTGVEKRMPWLNVEGLGSNHPAVLTTMGTGDWWGTMVTQEFEKTYSHSPWIHPEASASGTVLYWMREDSDDAVW